MSSLNVAVITASIPTFVALAEGDVDATGDRGVSFGLVVSPPSSPHAITNNVNTAINIYIVNFCMILPLILVLVDTTY